MWLDNIIGKVANILTRTYTYIDPTSDVFQNNLQYSWRAGFPENVKDKTNEKAKMYCLLPKKNVAATNAKTLALMSLF